MSKNKDDKNEAQKLRDLMFDQMARLSDPTANLELELKRASAIAKVGTVIVNSHKQEVELLKVAGRKPGDGGGGKMIPITDKKHNKEIGNG